jgi:hypothetical protein
MATRSEARTGLWVGRHTADSDLLVFDPTQADPSADRLSFYSLTQHRVRVFPRAVAEERIREVTDAKGAAQALRTYEDREALRAEHLDELNVERAARDDRQKEAVLRRHTNYLASIGRPYEGVRSTSEDGKVRRRSSCKVCGIALDDFAHTACNACDGVLCSCGACSCRAPAARA